MTDQPVIGFLVVLVHLDVLAVPVGMDFGEVIPPILLGDRASHIHGPCAWVIINSFVLRIISMCPEMFGIARYNQNTPVGFWITFLW